MRCLKCLPFLVFSGFALMCSWHAVADPTPFQTLFYNCHGDAWLGNRIGDPVATPNGRLQRYEHGSIFSSNSHNGCFGEDVLMVDGRLLDSPSELDVETFQEYVEKDPILPKHRKCVVFTLIDQRLRRDDCDGENIHPYCEGAEQWCSEFASWVYRNSGMRNIEGEHRHLSSVKWANQLRRVFEYFDAYIEDDDLKKTTAEPGDFLILKDDTKHTTLVVAVNLDASLVWTIGGSEGDPRTVRFRPRDYFNPRLAEEIEGVGLIRGPWFDFRNAYLEQCQPGTKTSFSLDPKDYVDGQEEDLKGRGVFCGELIVRVKNAWPNCADVSIRVIQGPTPSSRIHVSELEPKRIRLTSGAFDGIQLRAECARKRESMTVWPDRSSPQFDSVSVYMGRNKEIILEPVRITDDGFWQSSDYDIALRLPGSEQATVTGGKVVIPEMESGTYRGRLRVIDGCGRSSLSKSVEFTVNETGYVVDPGSSPHPDECPSGQDKNSRGECVDAGCDEALGWIFDPDCAVGRGCCVCAPPGDPHYNSGCIY